MTLSLLRGDLIVSKHSQCIVKSVKSIWVPQKACAKWFSFSFKALKHSFDLLEWWKSCPISASNSAKIFSLFTLVGGKQKFNSCDGTNFSVSDKTYADKLQILFPEFKTEPNRCLTSHLSVWVFCRNLVSFAFFYLCHLSWKSHPIKKCQKFSSFQTHFIKFPEKPDQFLTAYSLPSKRIRLFTPNFTLIFFFVFLTKPKQYFSTNQIARMTNFDQSEYDEKFSIFLL